MSVTLFNTLRSRTDKMGNTEWLLSRLDDCEETSVILCRGTTYSSTDYNYGKIPSGTPVGQDSTTKEWHPAGAFLTTADDASGNDITIGTESVKYILPGQTVHVYQGTDETSSRSTTNRTVTARNLTTGKITVDGSAVNWGLGDLVKRMGGSGDAKAISYGDTDTGYPGKILPNGTVQHNAQNMRIIRRGRIKSTKLQYSNSVILADLLALGIIDDA